jgi:hypothetical protein
MIYRVGVLDGVSVHKIEARTNFSIGKPGHISMFEGAGFDDRKFLVPGQHILRKISPELVWFLNRLLVHLLILFQAMDVRQILALAQFRMLELFGQRGFNDNLHSEPLRSARQITCPAIEK